VCTELMVELNTLLICVKISEFWNTFPLLLLRYHICASSIGMICVQHPEATVTSC